MSEREGSTRVAIACQGGGSHTAFTAGVLETLLEAWSDDRELVGLSGTSGGAINALLTWYGLVTVGEDRAVELLDAVWADLSAESPLDRWVNDVAVWTSRVESSGVPLPTVSPYVSPAAGWGQDRLRETIERHVDFEAVPELCGRDAPRLVVGTVDVEGGVFETFVDEDVTSEALLASTAVPDTFRAVKIHGHWHWDGLFSQNPPVNDLFDVDADRKPEELWVVQINPQEREGEPTTLEEIADRRNELSGNISLNQELRFIERVNDWIESGQLPDSYTRTTVRRIEIPEALHCSTKVDRSPAFIERLRRLGREEARSFLAGIE